MRLTAEDLATRFARLSSPDDTSTVSDILAFCTALIVSTLRNRNLTTPKQVRPILAALCQQVSESLAKDTIH